MRDSISSMGMLMAAGMWPAANSVAERTSMGCQAESVKFLSSCAEMVVSQTDAVIGSDGLLHKGRGLVGAKGFRRGEFLLGW